MRPFRRIGRRRSEDGRPEHDGPEHGAPATRLSARDAAAEAVAGVVRRPARSVLTALGTVLGVGGFVAVLGLTGTLAARIDGRFTVLTATAVTVEDVAAQEETAGGATGPGSGFPADAERRIRVLAGVREAGLHWPVTDAGAVPGIAGTGPDPGPGSTEAAVPVVAASPGAVRAMVPRLRQGRLYDEFAERTRQRVVLLGSGAAARLGVTTLATRPAVRIGGEPFVVAGILADLGREPENLLAALVPRATAAGLWGPPKPGSARMLVATEPGAARQVAALAPLALRPDRPEQLKTVPPPDPRALRSGVGDDLGLLFLLLAAVCLVVGAAGIAHTTLVAVVERTAEIGLRRALGARGRHVAAHVLAEAGLLGGLGGLVGTALGVLTVTGIATARGWTPVLSPAVALAAPCVGLAAGLLAGLYPAGRATRITPAEALRH
ncbi:FtsX-like permease family protein [Streptomyces sp. NPDC097619]|uniref:ABC transporter permease n=1 Tax=Streptomyces sp. NPDC097619 TaxID=3157228 RepID=UPI00331D6064